MLNRVRMLIYFGVTPYLVFDGDMLPSKAETETARAARRQESKRNGMRLYHAGRVVQAQQELQKAVDVTPYMARLLIEELKKLNIQYVVAPYEADAQLVYLERQGLINGILSEDSDMLVFGAKRLLSKLDPHGECIEINRADFTACREISLVGWSDESFRQLCILSGCDYLASIPGMGLKTAYRYLRKFKSVERVVRMVQFEGKSRVPAGYLEDFKRAELTFLHQRVFCPHARKLTTLYPVPAGSAKEEGDMPFIGQGMADETAVGVACGDLDPMTKEPIEIKQSYPERSRMVLSRRQTLPSATEKRPTHSITSFFTPKRVPLGELDPNSLTPSPSQQQVLEANTNRSWQNSPAPARPTPPSSTSAATPNPRPTPPSASASSQNSQRQDFLARAAVLAPRQPVKRQRLCSDVDESGGGGGHGVSAAEEHSRFFAKSTKSVNRTTQRKTTTTTPHVKKARKAEFGVFSDDSVENIMTQLPDDVGSGSKSTEVKPSEEEEEEAADQPEREEDGEGATHEHIPPTEARDQPSASASASASASSDAATLSNVEKPDLKLREKYRYGDSKPSATSEERMAGSRMIPRKTPLQRLGQAAVARSKSLNSLNSLHSQQMTSTPRQRGRGDEDGYESDCTAARSFRGPGQGSEDLIVPDSEEEEEEDDDDEADPKQPETAKSARFDVRRFAFAPVS